MVRLVCVLLPHCQPDVHGHDLQGVQRSVRTALRMTWDDYFLDIATAVSKKSKDPSSKIGAVIVGSANQLLSGGFNGFPRGIDETDASRWERPLKYKLVAHAEANAIYNAARHGVATRGSTLYLVAFGPPSVPCVECTKAVIQAGITKIVGRPYKPAPEQWVEDLALAKSLLDEAGVSLKEIEGVHQS